MVSACTPYALFATHRRFAAKLAMTRARRDPLARFDEYESAALLGLWLACLRYNPASTVPFTGFAYRRVVGEIINHQHAEYGRGHKRQSFRRNLAPLPSNLLDGARDGADDREEIETLLRLLPARTRQVIEDYYLGGLTMAEVGERIGVGQCRVSQLLREGLEIMRKGAS